MLRSVQVVLTEKLYTGYWGAIMRLGAFKTLEVGYYETWKWSKKYLLVLWGETIEGVIIIMPYGAWIEHITNWADS